MFYSNLLKGIASVAAALMLTSCFGDVQSNATNFKYVSIPEQTVTFKAKEVPMKEQGKAAYLISDIVVKAHDDIDLRYLGLKVTLVDKMGVELISLNCNDGVVEKGVLKLTEFSSEVSLTKNKKELEALVRRANSLRFTVEDWRDDTSERIFDKRIESLDKNIQNTIEKIEEITQESVDIVYKAVEGTLNTLDID